MQRLHRLKRELDRISQSDYEGISAYPLENKVNILRARIIGPNDTPYEKGTFELEILIPDSYPCSPPFVKFLTKIYHPNIDDSGRICLDVLKMPPKGAWRPTISIEAVLISIRMLMQCPNPDDPLMADIAEQYKTSYDEFKNKAKEWTSAYAHPS